VNIEVREEIRYIRDWLYDSKLAEVVTYPLILTCELMLIEYGNTKEDNNAKKES